MTIWDDIRRGAQVVKDETERLGRVAKLKAQVRLLESELGDRVYDLGTRALELHRKNELHHYELDEIFVEIRALQRKLRDTEMEIDALAGSAEPPEGGRASCPDCAAAVRPDDRFCPSCGGRLTGD